MHNAQRADNRITPAPRAFTLLEVVVAVGILAIVTVAIASIFATVGDTVTTGKRVSTLNRYSARLERMMRRDFNAMNRNEGFLVIRNEYARRDWNQTFDPTSTDSLVPLYDGQPESLQKLRRIDEIMFFAEGQYTSARMPLSPNLTADAGAARIYYGHGQKMPRDLTNERYIHPAIDETNDFPGARLGETSAGATLNPNEYAGDWTLLRHVTLLIPETERRRTYPDEVYGLFPNTNNADLERVIDHARQVAMQPAQQSIFHTLAYLPGRLSETNIPLGIRPVGVASARLGTSPSPANSVPWSEEVNASPMPTSGIVDIATTSLSEIQSWVISPFTTQSPSGAGGGPVHVPGTGITLTYPSQKPVGVSPNQQWYRNVYEVPRTTTRDVYDTLANPSGSIAPMRADITRGTAAASDTELRDQAQQLWMLDALPTMPFDSRGSVRHYTGARIRYEDQPPQLFATLPANPSNDELLMEAIEQADQEMLSSSIFLPHCSEFIVEWTYGIVDTRSGSPTEGQPIWYGLRRWAELGGGAQTYDPGAGDVLVADIFGDTYEGSPVHGVYANSDWLNLLQENWASPLGPQLNNDFELPRDMIVSNPQFPSTTNRYARYPLQRLAEAVVLRDRTTGGATMPSAMTAPAVEQTFGYIDYDEDANDDGTANDPLWEKLPWPKMIRVTVRLVDPSDETLETTYQATFRVPDPKAF